MFDEFQQAARTVFESAQEEGRLIYNPDDNWLRKLSLEEPEARKTKYGNVVAESEPMSRAAMFTRNNIDSPFGNEERHLLQEAITRLGQEELVAIDVAVGDGSEA